VKVFCSLEMTNQLRWSINSVSRTGTSCNSHDRSPSLHQLIKLHGLLMRSGCS
jgi:hypothetical protein